MNYYATGEGVTSCVVEGGSHWYAEEVLKKRIDGYFHRAIETTPISQEMTGEARLMRTRVPVDVKDALRRMRSKRREFFPAFYFNLA
jgi:hypothetical protein